MMKKKVTYGNEGTLNKQFSKDFELKIITMIKIITNDTQH